MNLGILSDKCAKNKLKETLEKNWIIKSDYCIYAEFSYKNNAISIAWRLLL